MFKLFFPILQQFSVSFFVPESRLGNPIQRRAGTREAGNLVTKPGLRNEKKPGFHIIFSILFLKEFSRHKQLQVCLFSYLRLYPH